MCHSSKALGTFSEEARSQHEMNIFGGREQMTCHLGEDLRHMLFMSFGGRLFTCPHHTFRKLASENVPTTSVSLSTNLY